MAAILLIDAHATHREYLATLLGADGHHLLQAADGSRALRISQTERPDLVMADILMPGLDCCAFVRHLHADPATAAIPVVLFTASYLECEARALAQACGASGVFAKPGDPEVVRRIVNAAWSEAPPIFTPSEEELVRVLLRLLAKLEKEVEERTKAEEVLQQFAARLRALSRQLLEIQEEERRRLARELHDEFGHLLAILNLHLHAAKSVAGEAAQPRLSECTALLQQAGDKVRSITLELRPNTLDVLGLMATLRWLADHHQQRTGTAVQLSGNLSGLPLPTELSVACFRLVQEALTNIARHAEARQVYIEINQNESLLELVIRDDGVGFDLQAAQKQDDSVVHFGLLGMGERVQLVGGSLEVESHIGQGTCIRASFPLSEAPSEPRP